MTLQRPMQIKAMVVFLIVSFVFTIYQWFFPPFVPLRDAINSFPFLGIIVAFVTIPLSILLILAYGVSCLLAKQEENVIRLVLAACFFLYAFLPWAGYMFEGALVNGESVGGFYMNTLFPNGWLAIISGLILVLYDRVKLNKLLPLKRFVLIAGILVILTSWVIGTTYGKDFIKFWHPGLEQYNIDVDSLSWGILSYVLPLLVFVVPFLSIFTGILLRVKDK